MGDSHDFRVGGPVAPRKKKFPQKKLLKGKGNENLINLTKQYAWPAASCRRHYYLELLRSIFSRLDFWRGATNVLVAFSQNEGHLENARLLHVALLTQLDDSIISR